MSNSIMLVEMNVKVQENPLQHLPQGVGVRINGCLRRLQLAVPVAVCRPPPRALYSLKACFRKRLRLSTMSLENIANLNGQMSSNTRSASSSKNRR